MSLAGKLLNKIIKSVSLGGEIVDNAIAGTTDDILVLIRDGSLKVLLATGNDLPTGTTTGYAKGCLFIDRNVVTGSKALYENVGTNTSCSFNLVGDISAGEITLAQGNVLIGNASGVAVALDGSTTTQIIVGNGTTMTSVAMSGDATMSNAGALTIAGGAVEDSMIEALADGEFLIGVDGTAANNAKVTMSGDAALANSGALTIATINSLATAAEVNSVCDGNTATAAEIIRACDVSTRVVSLTATAAITEVLHEGKVLVVTGTGAATYTLPEATGSGAKYKFLINEVNTSNNVIKTADTSNCGYYGSVNILDLDAAAQAAYAPAATDDLLTLNGTTSGGAIGDFIEVIDMATDKWMVFGQLQCPTGSNPATPFSGT